MVCQECGYWVLADGLPGGSQPKHCGRPMVETYADQGLLTLDRALRHLGRAIAAAFQSAIVRARP